MLRPVISPGPLRWGPVMMLRVLAVSLLFLAAPIAAHGQDDVRLAEQFRQTCEGGNVSACANLGLMYGNGQGVIQDYVRAHALFNIAAAQGSEHARSNRDIIARDMTPQQIADAQALARRCTETSVAECLR